MVLIFLGEAYQKSGDVARAREVYLDSHEVAKAKNSPMIRWIERKLAEVRE